MLVGLADQEHAINTLTAYLFAVAALTGVTPRALVERILTAVPSDEVWLESALPELMNGLTY